MRIPAADPCDSHGPLPCPGAAVVAADMVSPSSGPASSDPSESPPPAGAPGASFWDRLFGRSADGLGGPALPLPPGDGPLVWLRLDAAEPLPRPGAAVPDLSGAAAPIAAALRRARPALRLIVSHPGAADPAPGLMPDPGGDVLAARVILAAASPAVLLLVGGGLPATLLQTAERQQVPVIWAGADLAAMPAPGFWQRGRRATLGAVTRLFVPDTVARAAALRHGIAPARVEIAGALAEPRAPLGASDAERVALAGALRGRQLWFAVAVPEAEEDAVIAAHREVLGHAHRALLVLAPADPARVPALTAKMEATGLAAATRSEEGEPLPDLQVMIADDPGELGLWYRLAPFTFVGGTLSGEDQAARHPFEAAALGSAILRGPRTRAAAEVWRQLDAASATRAVRDDAGLAEAVEELMSPDRAAALAAQAWAVSTAGAAVAQRVAAAVLDLLPE